jgi:nucleoside-diphosphate-sugar epimerase
LSSIVITGADGFVGTALCAELNKRGNNYLGLVRKKSSKFVQQTENMQIIDDLSGVRDWSTLFKGVSCVIHCAAFVHAMDKDKPEYLGKFIEENAINTLKLAYSVANAGVKRMVFLSTIKVNGESTIAGKPFRWDGLAAPSDPYSVSKYAAERLLQQVALETGLEVVIVRPPLVYGPNVKGNMIRLLKLVDSGLPLPFGSLQNKRSIIGLSNLTDVLLECAYRDDYLNEVFLVCDPEAVSTKNLVTMFYEALHKRNRLIPVTPSLLTLASKGLGLSKEVDRLTNTMEIDMKHTTQKLGWSPKYSVEYGINELVNWYTEKNAKNA